MKLIVTAVFAALVLMAQPVLAKGDLKSDPGKGRLPEISENDDAAERALARNIETMIRMRLAMAARTAPSAVETDPAVMARHLAALNELSEFSEQTVLGLVAAAADDDARRRLAGALAPVVSRHEQAITAAFHLLGAVPLGRDNSLVKRAEIVDQTAQRRVLATLRALADQRESRVTP